jgi:DNA-binding response OmpR family regulator
MSAILVVDDEEAIINTLHDLFVSQHRFQGAGTVEEALGYLETEPFDVVLTDISLPDRSGVELLGLVRQTQPNTPVIIISGIDDVGYARGLLQMGAFGYLSKPFQLDEVTGTVARAIESRRLDSGYYYSNERRYARRYQIQVEARLSGVIVFDNKEGDEDEQMLMVAGYTQDISESGLGIVVPEGGVCEQTILGATFHVVLGLTTDALSIEAVAVRYEHLEGEKGCLIGAHITNMSGRDRVLLLKYLYTLGRNK